MSRVDLATQVIAHRGASRDRPENTRAAFDEALRQGADGIELDVQLSRDGVPVVFHDKMLSKAGGGRRRVAQLGLHELVALGQNAEPPRPRDESISTLEEVLVRYASRTRLLVEIKTRDAPARNRELGRIVAEMIRNMKLHADVLVLCFDTDVLKACLQTEPRIRPVLNLKPPPLMTTSIRSRLAWIHALSADVRTLTSRFGASVRRAGIPLFVYTCNTSRSVDRALAAGATAVMSDRPGWLAEQIARRAALDEA